MNTKALTLRLATDVAADLEAIAQVEDTTVTEEIRRAIADRIESRRNDPAFQKQLAAAMERNQELLERLAAT
ncbi:MAG: hypothetical protein IIC71_05315 [Acidobacteria bacterium]|nr:hypothetical protein [Acidobacteriota bacterium]